jgi:hypothetical protein
MKLWLIKRVCDLLTNTQDINNLIYNIYKKDILCNILLKFINMQCIVCPDFDLIKRRLMLHDIIRSPCWEANYIHCWYCDRRALEEQKGIIIEGRINGNPGLCFECMYRM